MLSYAIDMLLLHATGHVADRLCTWSTCRKYPHDSHDQTRWVRFPRGSVFHSARQTFPKTTSPTKYPSPHKFQIYRCCQRFFDARLLRLNALCNVPYLSVIPFQDLLV